MSHIVSISTKVRDETLNDIPPLAETGLPGFDTSIWYMLVAPAKTPPPIAAKLHAEVGAILGDATVRKQLISQGVTPGRSPPPDALTKFIRTEIDTWGAIARRAGVAGAL